VGVTTLPCDFPRRILFKFLDVFYVNPPKRGKTYVHTATYVTGTSTVITVREGQYGKGGGWQNPRRAGVANGWKFHTVFVTSRHGQKILHNVEKKNDVVAEIGDREESGGEGSFQPGRKLPPKKGESRVVDSPVPNGGR